MNKKSTSQSAPARLPAREHFRSSLGEGRFINLRVLVALVVAVTGVALVFFATSAPGHAKPGVYTDRGSAKCSKPLAAAPLGGPVFVSITPIRAPDRACHPGTAVASLDNGLASS